MKNNSIRSVVATGIGAALFVVIGMISIPTPVPNTSIQLQYALQALFSVDRRPVAASGRWQLRRCRTTSIRRPTCSCTRR